MAETGVAAMAGGVLVPRKEKMTATEQRDRHTNAENSLANLGAEWSKQPILCPGALLGTHGFPYSLPPCYHYLPSYVCP